MIDNAAMIFALVGALGVGSQWLAWRLQAPAIVLMLVAGLLAGPVTGLLDPEVQLGELFRPVIAVAVAVILFEGGITLNFRELGSSRPAIRRLVYVGGPLSWLLSTLSGHYLAGLSWTTAAVFGGILVVTGPTVIIPLLRQARLTSRPASILRWEAIVNDPVGALFAVFAFEVALVLTGSGSPAEASVHLAVGVLLAAGVGYLAGRALVRAFRRGWVPEYMKAPVLLTAVLVVYASTDSVLHESGLLAVTVMGVVMGNARLPSLTELVRFKEQMTILLVSGVFVLLAASLKLEMFLVLDWRAAVFVAAIVFAVRPIVIMSSLAGSDLPLRERAIIAWIAPRGVVAVAIAGFFGSRLQDIGFSDGAQLAPLAFAVVAVTVVLHGFSISPVARLLGLTSKEPPGIIFIGGSPFTVAFAKAAKEAGIPVLIADRSRYALRAARKAELPVFQGEILSEAFEHTIDINRYGHMIATTENDAYNALVCTNFGPEFGRTNVYQIARHDNHDDSKSVPITLGGRAVAGARDYDELNNQIAEGWGVRLTKLTEEYGIEAYRESRPDALFLAVTGGNGDLRILSPNDKMAGRDGDRIIAMVPPRAGQGKEGVSA
jgi:NhaP-type Na+/H+ or K+/H+ antiporter